MTGRPSVGVPTVNATIRWKGEGLLFEGQVGERPAVLVDGNSKQALSPVELLVVSAATCSAADVVLILQKQRVDLKSLDIAVLAERRPTEPRRLVAVHFQITVSGPGADAAKAERAVSLSIEKYCTVVASLAPDTRVTHDVRVA
jgi:putative redox protein